MSAKCRILDLEVLGVAVAGSLMSTRIRVRYMQSRQGVMHFRIKGKRDKIRFVPVHPMVQRLIEEYLAAGKHGGGWMVPSSAP